MMLSKICPNRNMSIVVALMLSIMAAAFVVLVPRVTVNFSQENVYLGETYKLIDKGTIIVHGGDPFAQNGPQTVYPPAAILHRTGSLYLMRAYLFLFSMLFIALLAFWFFRRYAADITTFWKAAFYGAVIITLWISIPLILVYPVEVNGMLGGACCLVLGLMLYSQAPAWGMFCLGLAVTFKGQFLALLPGLIFYVYFIDVRSPNILKHLGRATLSLAAYFFPQVILLPALWSVFGMFRSRSDLWHYAFLSFDLVWSDVLITVAKILGRPTVFHEQGSIRALEFSGYGHLTWAEVLFSFGFSMLFALRSIWKRIRTPLGADLGIDRGLTLFAWGALVYWVHFLFFYPYPYWYNVFVVLLMNIFLIASFIHFVHGRLARMNARWGNIFLAVVAFVALTYFARFVRQIYRAGSDNSNCFAPYPWMNPRA